MYSYEIHVDLDKQNLKAWLKDYKEKSELLEQTCFIKTKIKKIMKTVNGYHIYIKVAFPSWFGIYDKFDIKLILNTLELIFQSDQKRAIFNLFRILNTNLAWNDISVFFEENELRRVK